MLHPFVQVQVRLRRESNARVLAAMSTDDREAWFSRVDASIARCDAVHENNWVRYVELGGDIEIARKADPLSFPLDLGDLD
jgi:hypothetical protein